MATDWSLILQWPSLADWNKGADDGWYTVSYR